MIGVAFNGDETIIKSDQHVYQWDTGQKIMVSGLGDSSINQVHFSFNGLKTAYPVNVTNSSGTITVNIPNIVLRYGKDVYMYLCIKNTNGTVVTIKTVIIPVIKRNMPENYMYDDNETVAVKLDELQTEIQRSTAVDTDHETRITSLEEAKTNASGTTYKTLKERIDAMDTMSSKISNSSNQLRSRNSISPVQNQIIDKNENLYGGGFTTLSSGYWQSGEFYSSNDFLWFDIPVKPKTNYTLTAWQHFLQFLDCDKNYISQTDTNGQFVENTTIETPEFCCYIRVTLPKTYNRSNYMIVEGDTLPETYVKAKYNLNDNINLPFKNRTSLTIGTTSGNLNDFVESGWYFLESADIDGHYENIPVKANGYLHVMEGHGWVSQNYYVASTGKRYFRCINKAGTQVFCDWITYDTQKTVSKKKIAFIGDSITAGVGVTGSKAYHMYISETGDFTCLNYGIGSTGWYLNATGSVLSGLGNEGVGVAVDATGNNNFKNMISKIDSTCDAVVIFGGTNDYGGGVTMSELDTSIRFVLNYIQTNYPTMGILVLTPIHRAFPNDVSGEVANTQGLKLSDYVNKIKNVCAEYAVQCVDLYTSSGLNPENLTNKTTYFTDGIHPNTAGHKKIASQILDYCKQISKQEV